MPMAFVLVNTEVGSELDVLRELNKVDGIEEAFALYGAYDIILRVESESMARLKQMISWNIRKLDNVRTTITMIVNTSSDTGQNGELQRRRKESSSYEI